MLPVNLLLGFLFVNGDPTSHRPDEADGEEEAQAEKREGTKLPEVIVTGTLEQTGVPEVPIDATGSRDVFGPEEVERTGARDLNDLIQYLPAVSTRPYNGGESSAPSFSMRGLPDDGLTEYILVMIDGVPANPMPYGWTAFSFFPLMTEQVYAIDLIRGGYAVQYSPNTVGGVLNLITPPIPENLTYTLDSSFGTNNYISNVLSVGDTQGKFGYLVTVGERHGDGYRADSRFDYKIVDVRTRWTYDEDDWLAVRGSFIDNEHRPPGGLTQAQFEQDRFGNARPNNIFRGHRAVLDAVRHQGTADGFYEVFGWVSQTHRNLQGDRPPFPGPGGPTDHRIVDDNAYSLAIGMRAESQAEFLGLDHTLYYGVRASQELLPDRTVTDETLPQPGTETNLSDVNYQLTALSAHVDDTLQLSERAKVVLGVRAEWIPVAKGEDDLGGGDFDDEFFDLLPGASASYRLSDDLALYANYQRSFRAPQTFGFNLANQNQEIGFEHGSSYEVGVRADLAEGVSGSIAGWMTDFDDVGIFDENAIYQTIGNIESQGVDAVLRWDVGETVEALRGFSTYASFTFQDSEIVEAVDPANDGNQTPYAWDKKAAWNVQYETADRWRLSLGGVHVGESYSDEANTRAENANGNLGLNDSRTVWDTQIAKDFITEKAVVRLSIGATNVFDEDWFVHSRGGFFGGGKVAGAPQQFYASLSVSM